MLWPKFRERRQSPRTPIARLAKFKPAGGGPEANCVATELSGGGVRLSGLGTPIPDEFVLTFSKAGADHDRRYKVVWRNGSEIGAKLIEPAASDA
jgi:PilZ domain